MALRQSSPSKYIYLCSSLSVFIWPFRCCNTCDELKRAYEAKGWNTNLIVRNSTQCLKDKNNPFANVLPGEGCRVSGSMKVNKVAGNFHMTLGDSIVRDGAHIHQFVPSEAPGFNVSHTIHSLSFGNRYPSMAANPLDNGELLACMHPSIHDCLHNQLRVCLPWSCLSLSLCYVSSSGADGA